MDGVIIDSEPIHFRVDTMIHEEAKQLLFAQDKELDNEYKRLEPIYEIKQQLIQLRLDQGLSQQDLAARVGTGQSAISRLESGEYNPSVDFLNKIAQTLGKEVHIVIK